MKRSRFTESQIMAVLRQAEGGVPVPELCRELYLPSENLLGNRLMGVNGGIKNRPGGGAKVGHSLCAMGLPGGRSPSGGLVPAR